MTSPRQEYALGLFLKKFTRPSVRPTMLPFAQLMSSTFDLRRTKNVHSEDERARPRHGSAAPSVRVRPSIGAPMREPRLARVPRGGHISLTPWRRSDALLKCSLARKTHFDCLPEITLWLWAAFFSEVFK